MAIMQPLVSDALSGPYTHSMIDTLITPHTQHMGHTRLYVVATSIACPRMSEIQTVTSSSKQGEDNSAKDNSSATSSNANNNAGSNALSSNNTNQTLIRTDSFLGIDAKTKLYPDSLELTRTWAMVKLILGVPACKHAFLKLIGQQ